MDFHSWNKKNVVFFYLYISVSCSFWLLRDPYLLTYGTDFSFNHCGGELCKSVLMPQQSHTRSLPQNWSYPGTFLEMRSESGHEFVLQFPQSEMIKPGLKMGTCFLLLQGSSSESLKYFPDIEIQNISHCLLLLT